MASEWWTSPAEADRRLAGVTKLWADVQNAALGRGTKPLVPDALADEVVAACSAFRDWRSEVEGWTFTGVNWSDELKDWTERANAMLARVAVALKAAGKSTSSLPAPVTTWEEQGPAFVAKAFMGAGGLVLGLGVVAAVILMRGRG